MTERNSDRRQARKMLHKRLEEAMCKLWIVVGKVANERRVAIKERTEARNSFAKVVIEATALQTEHDKALGLLRECAKELNQHGRVFSRTETKVREWLEKRDGTQGTMEG